ncbi:MAG: DNA recombination protein RmuC [Gammaproteobacteria bacterium]|nr:DNA recombination protein RmuC [Gammaproteobacteria bacterium]
MMNDWTWITLAAVLGLLLGSLVTWLLRQRRVHELERELAKHEARDESADAEQQRLQAVVDRLAREALKQNNESFLQLAEQNLKKFQSEANADLEKREKAVEQLVKPIQDALKKTESQISEIERERHRAFGSITEQLKNLSETQQRLHGETANLVKALRRPEVRGQWGELTLRRLAELAGMVDHCDFYEQENQNTDAGSLRPDMIVRLPDERELIVDVKTPLDSYMNAMEATSDSERETALLAHARGVRKRINELAKKEYWNQFDKSPDFVILFIPGDQFLAAALDRDPNLIEDALRQKVMLATPTSFVALLKAVAYGWRQVALAENAETVRKLAEDLYHRLATYGEHMNRVGKSLGSAVDHFNKAVGSLERNVLPGARKFTELGVHPKKDMPELDPLDHQPRKLDNE